MKVRPRTQDALTRAVAQAMLAVYNRNLPDRVDTGDLIDASATLLLRNGRSLKDLVSFSSVLLPAEVPAEVGLPRANRLSWLLSAEVATFCPVPHEGWQAMSTKELQAYGERWRSALKGIKAACRRDGFLHVPFLRALGDEKPELWVELEQIAVPALSELFTPAPEADVKIAVLRRPFITWPVDGRNPRHFSRADRLAPPYPPGRFKELRDRVLAAWSEFARPDPYARPGLNYRLFDAYIDEVT